MLRGLDGSRRAARRRRRRRPRRRHRPRRGQRRERESATAPSTPRAPPRSRSTSTTSPTTASPASSDNVHSDVEDLAGGRGNDLLIARRRSQPPLRRRRRRRPARRRRRRLAATARLTATCSTPGPATTSLDDGEGANRFDGSATATTPCSRARARTPGDDTQRRSRHSTPSPTSAGRRGHGYRVRHAPQRRRRPSLRGRPRSPRSRT